MNPGLNPDQKKFTVTNGVLPVTDLNVPVKENNALNSILDKKIPPWKFLKFIFFFSFLAATGVVGINIWIDIYGLFLPVKGREIQVYNNDRISKYLLSYRYIPQNFNTAILGTSLSANLDISDFNREQNKFKIYNASVMGANLSEISPIAQNLVKGGMKKMIICFSPYMTKNSGTKEVELGPKIYYGAFGSKNLFETYAVAIIRENEWMPHKFPKNQINQFGVNHYQEFFKVNDIKQKIATTIEENKGQSIPIDPVAIQELKDLIKLLTDNQVDFIGYFHPVPDEILQSKYSDYQKFHQTVKEVVGNSGKLIDLNDPGFKHFTTDYSNYIDHGHLSQKGQSIITSMLCAELNKLN